jgi:hypothetical protein
LGDEIEPGRCGSSLPRGWTPLTRFGFLKFVAIESLAASDGCGPGALLGNFAMSREYLQSRFAISD